VNLAETTLVGSSVTLVPLEARHAGPLAEVGLDPSIWEFTPARVTSAEEMARYVDDAIRARARGEALPFAILVTGEERIVGSTRLGNIAASHRRLEIGWTWVAPPWQRTRINTEAKFLLLRHGFEVMGANRIELKTDALNERSRRAILRIGGREEGTLREHMLTASGRFRDTVYYSILRSEWSAVASALRARLEK
jgi:RimJ/RimL family protein N-acetyltransferase